MTLEERFWSKVDTTGGPEACWPWMGWRNHSGYGLVRRGKVYRAHRISWELKHGVIPSGLNVLHSCDNPPCCNDGHLFLGTQIDNVIDMIKKGRHYTGVRPTGDAHWSRRHPEKVKKGNNHPLRRDPLLAAHGEQQGLSKLREEDVIRCRQDFGNGKTRRELSVELGVTYQCIDNVVKRNTWKHVKEVDHL